MGNWQPLLQCCRISIQQSKCVHVRNAIWCPANLESLSWVKEISPSILPSECSCKIWVCVTTAERRESLCLHWFWLIDLVDAKCVGLEFALLRSSSCCVELMLVLIFLFYLCSAGTYQVGQSPKLTQTTSPSPSPPPHAYTPSLAHSPQQCQGGLLILLPTPSSPASSPQAFEAVPTELRPLTSPN